MLPRTDHFRDQQRQGTAVTPQKNERVHIFESSKMHDRQLALPLVLNQFLVRRMKVGEGKLCEEDEGEEGKFWTIFEAPPDISSSRLTLVGVAARRAGSAALTGDHLWAARGCASAEACGPRSTKLCDT